VAENSIEHGPVKAENQQIDHLQQGWSDANRKLFYETTQGSKLIPMKWYKSLEQADSDKPFNAPDHMDKLGFMYVQGAKAATANDLPIGFVADNSPTASPNTQTSSEVLRLPRLTDVGKSIPDEKWMGLTCASCHTGQLEYKGHTVQIDGAPSTVDFGSFTHDLKDAFQATIKDDAKFHRFSEKVLDHPTAEQENALRLQLNLYTKSLAFYVSSNSGTFPYGNGRVDALGSLSNSIVGAAMDEPDNIRPADAPVRFPPLWNAPNLDWVQWNGAAASPLARNLGEVLGVFGELDLKQGSPTMMKTSADLRNLYALEQDLKLLKSPPWSEDVFGKLDKDAVTRGKEVFEKENCQSCHQDPPKSHYNIFLRKLDSTKVIPLSEIGTDPTAETNFADRMAKTGAFKDQLGGKDVVPLPLLLVPAVETLVKKQFDVEHVQWPLEQLKLNDYRPNEIKSDLEELKGIKVPTLTGVWTRAPYLHNGSVPTLYDLFQPSDKRPEMFHTGNREFDPVKVGTKSDSGPSVLNTTEKGNSNKGHEGPAYGTELSEKEKMDLIEYLKSL